MNVHSFRCFVVHTFQDFCKPSLLQVEFRLIDDGLPCELFTESTRKARNKKRLADVETSDSKHTVQVSAIAVHSAIHGAAEALLKIDECQHLLNLR